jgi:hypothetical protein
MLLVRAEAFGVVGEENLFIRAYRVGHTLELERVVVVVEAQVKGGCHVIDENGHIGGDGKGRWYGVFCPTASAKSELVRDLRIEEAKRRQFLPTTVWVDESEGPPLDWST